MQEALEDYAADVVLLCECGEIGKGLGPQWLDVVSRICGTGFLVSHQSHDTCIVRDETVHVIQRPALIGPLVKQKTIEWVSICVCN